MLTKAVRYEEIKPLLINEDTFKMENFKKDNYIVGGFSVDYLGDYGKKLTYEDHISYIKTEDKKGEVGALTYQGDSGGAIIYKGKELHLNSLIKPDHFIFISLRYL
jgi:glutamine cyclotransferase